MKKVLALKQKHNSTLASAVTQAAKLEAETTKRKNWGPQQAEIIVVSDKEDVEIGSDQELLPLIGNIPSSPNAEDEAEIE